jgi:glycerophosphoryl diester phosphodiesterase
VTFGKPQYAEINALLNWRFQRSGTLVMAHRGTASGSIGQNTTGAVMAAVRSGADIVEIDVTGSTDGAFFVHHDGTEADHLTTDVNLRRMPAAAIEEMSFRFLDRPDRTLRIERLAPLLRGFRSSSRDAVMVNIDRSWWWWPQVLDELAGLDMTPQLLLKCRASNTEAIEVLASHPVKFPFMPICFSLDQAYEHLDRDDLNLVGVEVIAPTEDSPFTDPAVIAGLRARGVFVLANAEVLPIPVQCFPGLCDERAITDGSEAGWGRLFDLGFDVIQTDWPWLLADYREYRRASRRHRHERSPD